MKPFCVRTQKLFDLIILKMEVTSDLNLQIN